MPGKAVYDDLTQAACGIAGLFGAIDGAPRYAPVNICDRVVGLYLAIAISRALHHRAVDRRGPGNRSADAGDHGAIRARRSHGWRRVRAAARRHGLQTAAVAHARAVSDQGRPSRARGLHRQALACVFAVRRTSPTCVDSDPRFDDQETRTQHAEDMGHFLEEHLPQKTTAEWIALLREADIPARRSTAIEDLFDDPHLKAVKMFERDRAPDRGHA